MPIPDFRSLTAWMNLAIFAAPAVVVWGATSLPDTATTLLP
jgi:hypothetical protein